jgi:hypothetical protein
LGRRGRTGLGKACPGWIKRVVARVVMVGRRLGMAGSARCGVARDGLTRQGKAGAAGKGLTRLGMAWQGLARKVRPAWLGTS